MQELEGPKVAIGQRMLYRMYIMWAQSNNFKVVELNRTDGDVAGIKSIELEINGDYTYGLLQGENGVS